MDASTLLPLHHSASVRTNTEVRRIFNPTSLVPGVSERLPTPTHQTYLGRSPRLMAKESAQSSSVQFVGASQPPPLMPDTPYGVVSRLNAKVETSEIKRILAAAESELDATDAARRRRRGSGRQGRWTSKVPPPEPAAGAESRRIRRRVCIHSSVGRIWSRCWALRGGGSCVALC